MGGCVDDESLLHDDFVDEESCGSECTCVGDPGRAGQCIHGAGHRNVQGRSLNVGDSISVGVFGIGRQIIYSLTVLDVRL